MIVAVKYQFLGAKVQFILVLPPSPTPRLRLVPPHFGCSGIGTVFDYVEAVYHKTWSL